MHDQDWTDPNLDPLTVFLNGVGIAEPGLRGETITDDAFLILFNPTPDDATFTLPGAAYGDRWNVVFDTGDATAAGEREAGSQHAIGARSLVVLTHD
jgi:glycogen operon protein